MSVTAQAAAPELTFAVTGATPVDAAVVPTLRLRLRVATAADPAIRAVALNVQIGIAAAMRDYDAAAQARLLELFGRRRAGAPRCRACSGRRRRSICPRSGA